MTTFPLWLKNRDLQRTQAEQLTRILREADAHVDDARDPLIVSKLPGDPDALRGIPAIGRGVTGASPRTRPGSGIDRELSRRSRARALAEAAGYTAPPSLPPNTTRIAAKSRSTRDARALVIAFLRDRDGDQCYLCHTTLEPQTMHVDHIIPLAHGGDNTPANIAIACGPCNTAKSDNFVSITVTSARPCYHRAQHAPGR